MATYWDWHYCFNLGLLEETSGPDGTQGQWKIERKIPSTTQSGETTFPMSSTYKPREESNKSMFHSREIVPNTLIEWRVASLIMAVWSF